MNAYHPMRDHRHQIWPALDAAHIRPVTQGGEHRKDNGLLLRLTCTPCSTRVLRVDPSHGCGSVRDCGTSSATGSKSTQGRGGDRPAGPEGRPAAPRVSGMAPRHRVQSLVTPVFVGLRALGFCPRAGQPYQREDGELRWMAQERHPDLAAMQVRSVRVPRRLWRWLRSSGSGDGATPEQQLRAVISALARSGRGVRYRLPGRRTSRWGVRWCSGRGRPAPCMSWVTARLHGSSRRLLTAGTVPGWDLHPGPAGRTPLHVLAGPLHRLSGSSGSTTCWNGTGSRSSRKSPPCRRSAWFELRNCGTRFIAAVRQVVAGLPPGDAQTDNRHLPAPDDPGAGWTAGRSTQPACPQTRPGHCRSWPPGLPRNTAHRSSETCSHSARR